jgi:hypothetical protein
LVEITAAVNWPLADFKRALSRFRFKLKAESLRVEQSCRLLSEADYYNNFYVVNPTVW